MADETLTEIPIKYFEYVDVFLLNPMIGLLEHIGMNNYTIKLKKGKQSFDYLIYSLRPVRLEILKTYIEIHLKTGFIQISKSLIDALIFFDQKQNKSVCLYIDYKSFNNLTIENRNLLLLIGETLDRLGQAKHFTQLDLTNIYHQKRIWK